VLDHQDVFNHYGFEVKILDIPSKSIEVVTRPLTPYENEFVMFDFVNMLNTVDGVMRNLPKRR